MAIYTAPDGKKFNIPTDPSELAAFEGAVKSVYGGDIYETTVLGQARETLKGIPRGAIGMAVDIPLGAASLFDIGNDSDFVSGLQQYKDFLNTESSLAADPAYRDTWMTKLGEGAGSFVPFLGAGKIGQLMKARGIGGAGIRNPMLTVPAAIAIPSGIAQQADRVSAARELGEDVGGVAETFAELGGGIVGLTEILPIFNLFKRVPKNALQYSDIRRKVESAAKTGTAEGLQEVTASLAQDLIARGLYSDELPIGESLFDEFTIGGTVGALADLAVNSMSGRSRGRQYLYDREKQARENIISLQEEYKFQKAQAQGAIEEVTDTPKVVIPDVPPTAKVVPGPQLEVIQDASQAFSVVDINNLESPVLKTFDTEVKALNFKNKQETDYERKKLAANIENATYSLGMPKSGEARKVGATINDPNTSSINLQTLVSFDSTLSDEQKKLFSKEKMDAGFRSLEKGAPVVYNEMIERRKAHLEQIGKYVKSKGLDLRAAYTMPEAKKVLSTKDYNRLLSDLSSTVFQESGKAGQPAITSDKEKPNVNIQYIKDIAASKNIDLDFKDPAVRYAALQWTGTSDIPKSRNRGVKELFLARLHSLDKFNNRTSFPDFRPRKYQAVDMANFVASMGGENIQFTVDDLLKGGVTANDKQATEQFISDLTKSGRAEKVEGTNKYQIRKNHEFDIARRAEGFNETPEEFGERLRQENELPEENILALIEKEKVRQQKVLPPKEIDKKIFDFNEAVNEGRTNKFAKELKKELDKRGLSETGLIVSNDILSTTNLVQTKDGEIKFDPRPTRETTREVAVEGQYDSDTDIIFLSMNAVNPDGMATDEQILDRLSQVLDHEMIHAFRNKDLIDEPEYQYLRKEVKRRKVPSSYDENYKGRTFYQRAESENQDRTDLATATTQRKEELYVEEAIAEMYRARNHKPDIAPKSKGILNKIAEFFRSAGIAMRTSGFKRTSDVFNDIEQGAVGARERDQIRTLRELDRLPPQLIDAPIAQEFEEGEIEPVEDSPSPTVEAPQPAIAFEDIESDTDPITGRLIEPTNFNIPTTPVSKVYNEKKLSPQEREQNRSAIISGLVSAGVLRKASRGSNFRYTGVNDAAAIGMVKWLANNAPNKDYQMIANKVLESLNKLSNLGYKFPLELSSKKSNTSGSVEYKRFNPTEFKMSINNSPSSVSIIRENTVDEFGIAYNTNGVNFETLLHEALHQATLAHINTIANGDHGELSLNRKAREAYRELSLTQDRINDYISEKSKEWSALVSDGKVSELNKIRKTQSVTMQRYIDVLKRSVPLKVILEKHGKKNTYQQDFESHYFGYKVNGIQGGSVKKDLSELITFGLTNREMQDFLEHIPYSPKSKKSIWDKFVESIRSLIGLPVKMNTALSSFLKSASDVVDLGDIGLDTLDRERANQGDVITTQTLQAPPETKSIQARIDELNVRLMPLEAEMREEGGLMSRRNYQALNQKISSIKNNINQLNNQLREVERTPVIPQQLAMFSRAKRFADDRNTSENTRLNEAVDKAVEYTRNTARGEIPYYNVNASDVALEAAINFNEDVTAQSPSSDIPNYSRGSLPVELEEDIKRTGYSQDKTKSLGATLLDVINNPVENVGRMFNDFRQNYVDKLDKVEKKILQGSEENEQVRLANNSADTSTMAAMRFADKARGVFQGMLMTGYASDKIKGVDALTNIESLEIDTKYNPFIDGNTGTGGLMQIMSPLYSDPTVDLEAVFGYYAKTMRVETMENNGKIVDSPITERDKEQLALIRRKYPAVVEAYNNYQKWNNKLIEFAEAKGLLDAEQAAMWRDHSSYYPFYRDMVDEEGLTAPTIGGGSLPNNPLSIEMKGSEEAITANPVEAIARNSLSILTAAMKNDGTGKLLRDLSSMDEAKFLDSPQKIKASRNKIFVFENGQKKYYSVDDIELFHGVQAIGGVKTDAITKFLSFPSAILRDTVTRDPGFVVVNLLRDTLSAAITSGAPLGGEGFTPIIDTVKNMFADMSELEKFGVIGGYDFQNDEGSVVQLMERARRQKGLSPDNGISAKDGFFKLWDGLGALTTKSDGATRLAVYNAVYNHMKKKGATEAQAQSEAAYQSLEIINFGRRGLSPIFRVITSAIPFMNARIQGLDVLYRGSLGGTYSAVDKLEQGETRADLKNKIIRKFGLRASAMVAATAIYYLLVSDTDEYKGVKREVRDDNWISPNPFFPNHPIKIPIPFEVGMLFKAIPERLFDMAMGEDAVEKSPGASIWRQLGTSADVPFIGGDIGIQALKPLFEAVINRNSFTDTEIVPYYKLKEQPAYQARQSTNEVARLLGEAMNISPMKIEHVLSGYSGTLGGYVLSLMDVAARSMTGTPIIPPNINDVPVFKRLFFDLDKAGGLQQQFYELREVVDGAVLTMNDLRNQKRFDELAAFREHNKGVFQVKSQIRAIERYMANWRKRRDRLLRRTDVSPIVKSDMLRDMELDRDKRLAIIPTLRERADVPAISMLN